jgi:WD40 repeat protein
MIVRSYLEATPVIRPGTRAPSSEYMTMSADGRLFAVRSSVDSVSLWSLAQGPGRVLPVPGFVTGVMAFSPDGNAIAIAGGMFGLYVYDTRTGAPIRAFNNFPGALSGAWFSADGKSIITRSSFDDRLRIVYVDPTARPATQNILDDSLTAQLPLGPPPSTSPRTIGGIVTGPGPNPRAVGGADVAISNGDSPDAIIARTTTSPGGYFSFPGIRFRHILIRVQKPGFAPGVKYIHVNRWENDGPWGIELTPRDAPR